MSRAGRTHDQQASFTLAPPAGHRFIVELAEEFDGVHFDVGEIRDLGERLVGFGRFRARGNASGVEIDVPLGMVGVMREKKVVYARFFSDPAEALEAAGLRE